MKINTLLLIIVALSSCKNGETTEVLESTYPIAKISTRLGDMYFWLYDETPNHKAKFIELANENLYNEFTMNRVVKNFVIQGGCPDSVSYFENSPYLLDPEFVDSIGHSYGALGMGRDGNAEKRSNACQFYIVSKEEGLPRLDGDYVIFGEIIEGENVLEAIEKEDTDNTNTPLEVIPLQVSIEKYSVTELSEKFDWTVD